MNESDHTRVPGSQNESGIPIVTGYLNESEHVKVSNEVNESQR